MLTARNGGVDFGATASALTSLCLDPPMLLACLNTRSSAQEAIYANGLLGVNILDEDQGPVAERFASRHGDNFAGLNVVRGEADVPLLADSLAYCECEIAESVVAGTHRVFLSRVAERSQGRARHSRTSEAPSGGSTWSRIAWSMGS